MAYDFTTLVGKSVRIGRGGPESKIGKVVSAGTDYVVLENAKEGIIYYNAAHLKSISIDTKASAEPPSTDPNAPPPTPFLVAASFEELMELMVLQWVQVNRGGPDGLQGVMTDYAEDALTLVINHELIVIFTEHVKSISNTVKTENKNENKNENKSENKSENKEENKEKS